MNETCLARFGPNTKLQLQDLRPGDQPKGNCVIECIANDTKVYKGNGAIDNVRLKQIYMNSVSGIRRWGNIVAEAVDLCVNESKLNFYFCSFGSSINLFLSH
jgi:hypothetical protein